MTFSIVARDASGCTGVAVATRTRAVGAWVPAVAPGIGAVATQSWTNRGFRGLALESLARGASAVEALEACRASDPEFADRQLTIVSATGAVAQHTGNGCSAWAGHIAGDGYGVAGNLLTGPEVLEAMAGAFEAAHGSLATRLVEALLAGDAAGGDRRGRQSAAVVTAGPERRRRAGAVRRTGPSRPEPSYPELSHLEPSHLEPSYSELSYPETLVDLRIDDDPDAPTALAQLLRG